MHSFRNYLLILALSLGPLLPLFISPDLVHTHDGAVHLPRMAAYYKALLDGQILPRWAGDLNYGYGLPLFNFIYQMPYLIASLFIWLGTSLVNSFKLVIALSFILSGFSMFAFSLELFKDFKKALLSTIFYQFAPFRLVEMNIRGSFGEMYTYVFLPLVLFGLSKFMSRPTFASLVITVLGGAGLIISHNSISLIFFGAAALFILFRSISLKAFLLGCIGLVTSLALSAFYWLPAILEHKYTYGNLLMKDLYKLHFAPFQNFFIPNITNNPSLQIEGISIQIGLFHVIALLLGFTILFSKRTDRKVKNILLFSSLLTFLALFLASSASRFLWDRIALLRQFQFPWRLLALINFSTSLAAISFLNFPIFRRNALYVVLAFLTVVSTVYYWNAPLGRDKIPDENKYWNYPLNTTYYGETDLIWSAGPANKYPVSWAEVIEGNTQIEKINRTSKIHAFKTISKEKSRIVDHTQYFPGWRVYVDNQKVPIEFQDVNWRGLITFDVPSGSHEVKVIFEKSKTQLFSETISIFTIIALIFLYIFFRRRIYAKK